MNLKTFSTLLTLMALNACSTPEPYRDAETIGDLGHSEVKIDKNQYTVAFRMRGENAEKATDFALLRAAELTLKESYTWFVVTSHSTDVDHEVTLPDTVPLGSQVKRNCGLIGCATTVTYPVGTMRVTTYNESLEVDSVIHIVMGKGQAPDAEDVYVASQLIEQFGTQ